MTLETSLFTYDPHFRVEAFVHAPWPSKLLYAFPPLRLIPPLLGLSCATVKV